jgi:hypothetical protein
MDPRAFATPYIKVVVNFREKTKSKCMGNMLKTSISLRYEHILKKTQLGVVKQTE